MKLVTFLQAGTEKIGAVLVDGRILDFAAVDARLAVDMLTLIRRQDELMPVARGLAASPPAAALIEAAAVKVLVPPTSSMRAPATDWLPPRPAVVDIAAPTTWVKAPWMVVLNWLQRSM